jgi:hypothetical protein
MTHRLRAVFLRLEHPMTITFKGAAKRLDDIDLPRIGAAIGVREDVIHAIIDVEAPKSGFDDQGRPRILFEPHVFYRNLPAGPQGKAVEAGLAYKAWRSGAYGPESAQYGKLERAMAIDEAAALKACSWGRSQILGENHLLAGYATPQAMVDDFCADEENHIEAMVRFLKGKKLDVHLRRIDKLGRPSTPSDWIPVASGYNGSGYATHNYHGRLADRHNWWRGKPDTPWTAVDPVKVEDLPTQPYPTPLDPPPSVIVSDARISKSGFWSRFWAAFTKRTSA